MPPCHTRRIPVETTAIQQAVQMAQQARDHGGGIDAAAARFGGNRDDWIDLSTGINPVPYPIDPASLPKDAFTALPDQRAFTVLETAAREFWNIPEGAAVLAAPGASALIAALPGLLPPGRVQIDHPTYNEHGAAFDHWGWTRSSQSPNARVIVHPNNPTGSFYSNADVTAQLVIIDESFCDIAPDRSLIYLATRPGTIILKSFGKFWGLAGLRLGFAIGDPSLLIRLKTRLGPWAASGPALAIGARALGDTDWAKRTRARLDQDATKLDTLMQDAGATPQGGTALFRLYSVDDAEAWQTQLAEHHIWTRVFPYSKTLIRLGLPAPDHWPKLKDALCR